MKKIILSVLVISSLLQAEQSTLSQEEQIANTKAQIEALQANLKKLEAALPVNVEKQKAIKLAKQKEKNKLVTHTELGYISTKGNTDTTTFSIDSKIKKAWDKHLFELAIDGQYAKDEDTQTKNKYLIELNYDYKITDRFYFDYLVGYKKDKFSAYNYQTYTGPGAKYKAIVSDKHNLTLDGNILYSQDELEGTNKKNNYSSFRAKGLYELQVAENLKFIQEASYRAEIGDANNYFVFSKTALVSKINSIFSAGINYKIDYVNLTSLGTQNTDKTLTANLIVDY